LTPWQQFTVKDPITIAAGATVELSSAYAGMVNFAADTGTLQIDHSQSFTGTVVGLNGQDTLDLRDIGAANARVTFSGDSTGGVRRGGAALTSKNIHPAGNYLPSPGGLPDDGPGGTMGHRPAGVRRREPDLFDPT